MINEIERKARDLGLKHADPLEYDLHWNRIYQKMSSLIFKQTILKLTQKVYSGALAHSERVEVLTIAAQGNQDNRHWSTKALRLSRLIGIIVEEYVWGHEFLEAQKWLLYLLTKVKAS